MHERISAYQCSGEINYRVTNSKACIQKILDNFISTCIKRDGTDGLSMEFSDWRFNLRMSNTEPLLRLNFETRGDAYAVKRHVSEIEKNFRGDSDE